MRIAERGGAPNCRFVEADGNNIAKVVGQAVDHVFLANAFHGVPDKPGLARAVHDILQPGGLFAIMSWYARPREQTRVLGVPRGPATELRMTPDQTIASVEPGGLQFHNLVEVSPYHYGVVFERQH